MNKQKNVDPSLVLAKLETAIKYGEPHMILAKNGPQKIVGIGGGPTTAGELLEIAIEYPGVRKMFLNVVNGYILHLKSQNPNEKSPHLDAISDSLSDMMDHIDEWSEYF